MNVEANVTELCALFEAFLPADLASRYTELLRLKPARWKKIDPWRVWDHVNANSVVPWPETTPSLLRSTRFALHADQEAVVLRCGHDHPAIERRSLGSALVGEAAVLEGFVSVRPGKLGLVVNHDGEICLLLS